MREREATYGTQFLVKADANVDGDDGGNDTALDPGLNAQTDAATDDEHQHHSVCMEVKREEAGEEEEEGEKPEGQFAVLARGADRGTAATHCRSGQRESSREIRRHLPAARWGRRA